MIRYNCDEMIRVRHCSGGRKSSDVNSRLAQTLQFSKLNLIESQPHTTRCGRFAKAYHESRLISPNWARAHSHIIRDYIVEWLPEPPECKCAQYFAGYNVETVTVELSKYGRRRIRKTEWFFLHTVKSIDDLSPQDEEYCAGSNQE